MLTRIDTNFVLHEIRAMKKRNEQKDHELVYEEASQAYADVFLQILKKVGGYPSRDELHDQHGHNDK